MNRQTLVELTNMCIVINSKQVLVEEKIINGIPGLIFPGGHVEAGESIHDSVIREVKEETGLTVSNLKQCGIKDWIQSDGSRYIVLLYKTSTYSGNLKASSEGNVYWIDIDELPHHNPIWNAEEILRITYNEEFSELFFDNTQNKWDRKLLK